MKKIFIFDCDGVLLNLWIVMKKVYEEYTSKNISDEEWEEVIDSFLHDPKPYKEFGDFFDNSFWFDKLPPMDFYIVNLITKLRLSHNKLAIVTSVNDKNDIMERRRENIEKIFSVAFEEIIYVGRGQAKEEAIKTLAEGYDFSLFIDDSLKNVAKSVGLVTCPVWYENKYHLFQLNEIDPTGIKIVKNARELETLIIQESGPIK